MIFMRGGAVAEAPTDPQFDPSDVYFQAYLEVRAGEQLQKDEDFAGALQKFQLASELFGSVSKFYPEWKADMVRNRSELTTEALAVVREKAGEQIQKKRGVIAELEGGSKVGGNFIEPPQGVAPLVPKILEVDPLQARQLAEAKAEIERLRNEMSAAQDGSNAAMRNASRVEDLRKQNNSLAAKLKAAEINLQAMRAQMAAAPVESEMKSLNGRIEQLEQEREAMGMALRTSRGEHTEALSKIEILAADMAVMQAQAKDLRQHEADTKRDLETERKVSNEVVAGQRRQMDALEKALEVRSNELVAAKEQIASFKLELDESRAAFSELREERDSLLGERDQMAALLKLNESGRIEQLIEQNMGLAKDLRVASENVQRMNKDSNAAKDDVVDALRDLAIAKSQINKLHQEKKEQDKRIAELKQKLENEEKALASGQGSADPAETEMLREVIRRQLRVQERRRQAKDLLVEAARSLGKQDAKLEQAIQLFDSTEIELTPEEQKLVADQQVDGEFVSPYARDRATVGAAVGELNKELESYDRAATKAYLAGRLLPTRELFQMMVEQNPGHVPAICKLGVVQMKLGETKDAMESFQKAIELDGNNPHANRTLGYVYMTTGDLASAELYVKKAVDLAPDDYVSQRLLGSISYKLGRLDDAEASFKASITANPIPSESYFNLAILYANDSQIEEAKDYYNRALERGAVPDQNLEKKLEQKKSKP